MSSVRMDSSTGNLGSLFRPAYLVKAELVTRGLGYEYGYANTTGRMATRTGQGTKRARRDQNENSRIQSLDFLEVALSNHSKLFVVGAEQLQIQTT